MASLLSQPSLADQALLDEFLRNGGDLLAFSRASAPSPCEALLWSQESQIQPWIEALQSMITRAREQQVADALSSSLEYLQTTLDSADAPTRLRTINSIIRLGQSILRATRPPTPRRRSHSLPAEGRAGVGLSKIESPARNAEHAPASRVKHKHAAQRNTVDSIDVRPSSTPPAEPQHSPEPDLSAECLSANPEDPQPRVASIAEQESEQTNRPFTSSNHQVPALADAG